MKRILAVFFVLALGLATLSGCASTKTCPDVCLQAMDQKIEAIKNQPCDASACEAAAQRAEAAANRAEAAANKAESIFMQHMKK